MIHGVRPARTPVLASEIMMADDNPGTELESPERSEPGDEQRELLREMYWARESAARGRMLTAEIRDRLHDFAAQMRTDETAVIPLGEGNLASPSKWRRQLKRRLWRLMRPATWRYDRLLADHAELTTSLAEKVMVLEAEVDRLKGDDAPDQAHGASDDRGEPA